MLLPASIVVGFSTKSREVVRDRFAGVFGLMTATPPKVLVNHDHSVRLIPVGKRLNCVTDAQAVQVFAAVVVSLRYLFGRIADG